MEVVSKIFDVGELDTRSLSAELAVHFWAQRQVREAVLNRTLDPNATMTEAADAIGMYSALVKETDVTKLSLMGHPRGECLLLTYEFGLEKAFSDISFAYQYGAFSSSTNTSFYAFEASNCTLGFQSKLAGFVIKGVTSWDDDIIYLPREYLADFPQLLLPSTLVDHIPDARISELIGLSPYLVRNYFAFSESYLAIPANSLRLSILQQVFESTATRFEVNEVEEAVRHLLKFGENDTALLGFSGNKIQISTVSVWLIAAALWILFRAGREINVSKNSKGWMAADVGDTWGLMSAVVFAVIPYLLTVFAALSFVSNMNIKGLFLDWLLFVDSDYSLVLRRAPPIGWIEGPPSVLVLISSFVWWISIICSALFFRESLTTTIRSYSESRSKP